jgi:hypothetical protein
MTGYFTLTGCIAVIIRKRGDELQHLTLALGELISGFLSIGSHTTTLWDLFVSVKVNLNHH